MFLFFDQTQMLKKLFDGLKQFWRTKWKRFRFKKMTYPSKHINTHV